ncbi:MAG: hypothetical protein KKH92_10090 [Firmicutes bacterium]|nr:hypothetical protein [Bacillota bacterium]
MRRITKYTIILSVILFVTSFFLGKESSENILFIFEQPFVFIGKQLRSMSLSGGFGNFTSIFIYILISGIPLWILGFMVWKKKAIRIDYICLPIISISLFFLMYLMINQNLVIEMLPPLLAVLITEGNVAALRIYNVGMILTLDVILLLYIFTRYFLFKKVSIYKLISVILYIIILSILIQTLLIGSNAIWNNETVNRYESAQKWINYLFKLALTFMIVFVLIKFQLMSKHIELNVVDKNLSDLTKKISKLSVVTVFVILSEFLFINIYQIIFSKNMENIRFALSIPMFELFIVMVMLLIAEYVKRTYDIHEENALTI